MPVTVGKSGIVRVGGWKRLRAALDPKGTEKRLRKYVALATNLNARQVAAAIRREIKTGSLEPNAALTIDVKGSEKPLVGRDGELFRAITGEAENWKRGKAGVLRAAGDPLVNIGIALHEGYTLAVTPKMRALFNLLWLVTSGQKDPNTLKPGRAKDLYDMNPKAKWYPIDPSTTAIVVVGRPFVKNAVEDPAVRDRVFENYRQAVERAVTRES